MKTKLRAGIFGGSFDPIHNGHLIIAETIREMAGLDKVIFIPVGEPSHRDNNLVAGFHRYNMVSIAIENNPYFTVSDVEIAENIKNYTIDTLKKMIELYPEYEFCEIIGEDSAQSIEKWKDYEELVKITEIYVFKRYGYNYNGGYENIKLMNTPIIEISATEIRDRIKQGKTVRYLISQKVEEYITDNKLYK